MRRFTTPTHRLIIRNLDLTGMDVYVTYRQNRIKKTIQNAKVTYDGENTTIEVYLTQEDTGCFDKGVVKAQINWIDENDQRNATVEKAINVSDNLLNKEVHYVGNNL